VVPFPLPEEASAVEGVDDGGVGSAERLERARRDDVPEREVFQLGGGDDVLDVLPSEFDFGLAEIFFISPAFYPDVLDGSRGVSPPLVALFEVFVAKEAFRRKHVRGEEEVTLFAVSQLWVLPGERAEEHGLLFVAATERHLDSGVTMFLYFSYPLAMLRVGGLLFYLRVECYSLMS
jgi:hypothetical protein